MRTKLKRALFGVMAGIMVANTPLTTLAAYTPANEPDDTTGHSAETASDKEAKRDQEEKSILEQKDLYTYLGEMEEAERRFLQILRMNRLMNLSFYYNTNISILLIKNNLSNYTKKP